jgi:hypothetical protein
MKLAPTLMRRISRAGVMRLVAIAALICAGFIARLSADDTSPNRGLIGTRLVGVDCNSAGSCVSVGSVGGMFTAAPLAALFESGEWTDRSPPVALQFGDSALSAVSCAKSRSCIGVGTREIPTKYLTDRSAGGRPLTAEWDGTRWRLELGAFPVSSGDARLNAIDCASWGCLAVGDYERRGQEKTRTLAESWDGKAWTLYRPENLRFAEDAVLNDVACTSGAFCTAVGYFTYELEGLMTGGVAPLVERWDSTARRLRPSPVPTGPWTDAELNAVACPSHKQCFAVGFQRLSNGRYATLAFVWNGMKWRTVPTRDPAGSSDAELEDVACPRVNRCVAVGWKVAASEVVTLAARWDGKRWTLEAPPNPPGSTSSVLHAVDCVRWTVCHAVGSFSEHSPVRHAFSTTWDGSDWDVLPIAAGQ